MKPGICAVRRSLKSMLFVMLSVIGLDGVVAGDCGCRRPTPFASVVAPAFLPTPVLMPGCPCAGGLQLAVPGSLWMSPGGWATEPYPGFHGVTSLPAVPAWPGSLTDGGVHFRYPNYSYRAPWNHPGPAAPRVNIVW